MKNPRLATLLWACAAVAFTACSKTEPVAEVVRAVKTITLQPAATQVPLEFAAEVKARTESRLGFRVGGKIVSRSADLGDAVRAGALLAQLDPRDLKLGSEAAQAALSAAHANHAQAAADYKRFKELRDQGFISSAELERRDTALKSARAALDQATAQARAQGNQAGYASLVAGAAGVITGVEAEPGQVVAAGAPVVRLAHDGPRDVVFAVPEDKAQVLRTLAGKDASLTVTLWGGNSPPLKASVREVAAAADPVTRTYLVKADVGRADVKLGQTATVTLDVGVGLQVLRVPLTALFEKQGQNHVWVYDEATQAVRAQPVQVAGADADGAVLASGVKAGQQVVTAGVHVLTEGQKVRLFLAPAAVPASASASR